MAEVDAQVLDRIVIPAGCRERFLPLRLPALAELRQLDVEFGGISDLIPPYEVGRPACQCHVIIMVIEGEAVCRTPTTQVTMSPGQTWVLPAYQPHEYWPTKRWLIAWLHLTDTQRWSLLCGEPVQPLPFTQQAQMHALMEGLLTEALLSDVDQALTLSSYSHLMAVLLERMLGRFDDPHAARGFQTINRLKEAVAADPGHGWSTPELATRLRMSPAALKRLTRAVESKGPMEIVTHLRLQMVQELLYSTDYTLERIAGLVGYATPFALSRTFKRHMGMSPQAFRSTLTVNGKQAVTPDSTTVNTPAPL